MSFLINAEQVESSQKFRELEGLWKLGNYLSSEIGDSSGKYCRKEIMSHACVDPGVIPRDVSSKSK